MSRPYEGDVSVSDCWSDLSQNPQAFLVDVRTSAEWNFVGFPIAPESANPPIFAEWQSYPTMSVDSGFVEKVATAVEQAGGSKDSPLYFLCRSGVRSMSSAAALTAAGFTRCFNVEGGFEGPPDAEGHRGQVVGWKAAGLPWAQK